MSEVEAAKGSAWFTDTEHNVFLDSGDDLFPQEHVRNRFEGKVMDEVLFFLRQLPTTVASLAYDCLDQKASFESWTKSTLFSPKQYVDTIKA